MSRGLAGHLDLTCAADAQGRSYLRRQSFRAPMHLSKPHEDGGVLVVNMVNPTAGLLAGDRIRVRVEVETGARLLVTTPGASRAHRSPDGHSEVTQELSVAAGALLEWRPGQLIPQAGACYRQRTEIRVEEGGELLYIDCLAPGRVAMGEAFAYRSLRIETNLFAGLTLAARERYSLETEGDSLQALRRQFATGYYASCFVISPRLPRDAACFARIHALHEVEAWIGVSTLPAGGWAIKLLTANSLLLQRKLRAIRQELYAELQRGGDARTGSYF